MELFARGIAAGRLCAWQGGCERMCMCVSERARGFNSERKELATRLRYHNLLLGPLSKAS